MTPYGNRLTPLVKRMAEDMLVRNFSPSTIDTYTYQVDRFQKHFDKPIEELGEEEIHQYQVYLVQVKKSSWSAFNLTGMMHLFQNLLLGRELVDSDCRLAADSVTFSGPSRPL